MLLQLVRKTAQTSVAKFSFYQLIDGLAKNGFAGALAGLRDTAAKLFGVPLTLVSSDFHGTAGDIFFAGDNKLLYMKSRYEHVEGDSGDPFADPGKVSYVPRLTFEVGLIAPIDAADEATLDSLCDTLSTILEIECDATPLNWAPLAVGQAVVAAPKGQPVAPPTAGELELAVLLRERKIEPLLAVLQDKRGEIILDQWLAERTDSDEIEYFIDKLFENDFFEEEIVVYSRETGQPLIRAKDRAGLEALKAAGVRDVNGDELDIENVRRLLILPKEKRAYLSKNWVTRVTLIDLLLKLGLTKDGIHELEMSDGHSVLYASYDGRPFLFVLGGATLEPKDFAALAPTIKSVGAPVVVAVARREVDTDAAVAAGAASCLALRGAEEFTTTLLDYLTKSRQEAITQVMAEFDGLFKLNVAAMSLARLSSAES